MGRLPINKEEMNALLNQIRSWENELEQKGLNELERFKDEKVKESATAIEDTKEIVSKRVNTGYAIGNTLVVGSFGQAIAGAGFFADNKIEHSEYLAMIAFLYTVAAGLISFSLCMILAH